MDQICKLVICSEKRCNTEILLPCHIQKRNKPPINRHKSYALLFGTRISLDFCYHNIIKQKIKDSSVCFNSINFFHVHYLSLKRR